MKSKISVLAPRFVLKRTRSSNSHSSVAKKLSTIAFVVSISGRSHRGDDADLLATTPESEAG